MADESGGGFESRATYRLQSVETKLTQIENEIKQRPTWSAMTGTVTGILALILGFFWFPFSGFISATTDNISDKISIVQSDVSNLKKTTEDIRVDLKTVLKMSDLSTDNLSTIARIMREEQKIIETNNNIISSTLKIEEIVSSRDDLNTFSILLRWSGIDFPPTEGGYTVFAPTNVAFRSMDENVLARISERQDNNIKRRFWENHVIFERIDIGIRQPLTNKAGEIVLPSGYFITGNFLGVYDDVSHKIISTIEGIVIAENGNIIITNSIVFN